MNNYNDFSARSINIIKVDISGNNIWNKKYLQAREHRTLSRMLVLDNGNIVCVGRYGDYHPTFYYERSWILMLNYNGDSLWYHEYVRSIGQAVDNILRDIKPAPDGGYICCGEFSDGLNGIPQSLWVLKLDSTGWYYGMGIEGEKAKVKRIKVFPNPASTSVTIDLSDFVQQKNIRLYLTNPELKELEIISVPKASNSITLDLSRYASGVYFIRLQSGREILGVEKIIKE
jgi:hypothetical protein